LCGYPHKNQRGLELKIILSIETDEEPLSYVSDIEEFSTPKTDSEIQDRLD